MDEQSYRQLQKRPDCPMEGQTDGLTGRQMDEQTDGRID
jgi:hypothetical protein